MAKDLIRYDLRVQEALRGVIQKVLTEAAREGLPGEHFFQITFRTMADGVRLSTEMRQRFPDEMTIILQYQFRDLIVNDHALEVVLFFNHVPEKLLIPFTSISGFFDPSVQFGLRFDVPEAVPDTGSVAPVVKLTPVASQPRPTAADKLATSIANRETAAEPTKKPKKSTEVSRGTGDGDAKIVSIDAFRRKP